MVGGWCPSTNYLILDHLPTYCKEKISYNVPYFYGKKGIVIIWPASIPRGGIKSGVLLGFWQGYFYKIYQSVEEIEEAAIGKLLTAAIALDASFWEYMWLTWWRHKP